MLALVLYDVVVAIHVMAIVIAFGVTFAYPMLIPHVQRRHPRALPALHDGQRQLSHYLIAPFALIALASGAYLATDAEVWDELWVTVPLVILIVLMVLGGAFFGPRERRLAELAQRDVEAAPADGEVRWSEDYRKLAVSMAGVGTAASVLVLVAIFFMVAKP